MNFVRNLKIRWKLLAVVMPLVVLPVLVVGSVVGYIANDQAVRGITQTSADDLEHMAQFTLDLLNAHYQQFQVYKEDKKATVRGDLAALVNFAHSLVATQHRQLRGGALDRAEAQAEARAALKRVNVGETGYIYAMTSGGDLVAHIAREGENILAAVDENGRHFIREMCEAAVAAGPGEVLFTEYPWRNAILGDEHPRRKVVAYRYFEPWDWIVAAGSYLDETYEDTDFERRSLLELKERIKSKRVGRTGYIYAMDTAGTLTVHPFREGENIYGERDSDGRYFIREMCTQRSGWIRYPWKNAGDLVARSKIVRYEYFEPWDWVVAVGSYEDEFYSEANKISGRIFDSMLLLTLAVGVLSTGLVFWASKVLTDPIRHMRSVIREVKRGRLSERMEVTSRDELGDLADAFNRMIGILERNRAMEAEIAQQTKMASLGVLSSGVAHEINNPLGVILGFAGYLEGKLSADDPNLRYVQEIKRESTRCKRIVQDLLSYARIPKPALAPTDVNAMLEQIIDFAGNRPDLEGVEIVKDLDPELPPVPVDEDQLRQVSINLILNAGAAMTDGGRLTVRTTRCDERAELVFEDTGGGIVPENLERIFEPFFTTRSRGTGLGLAITKQIVERHHGTIELHSEVGVGTRVTVRLPLHHEEF